MLVLSRKLSQSIIIDQNILITVVQISGNRVRIGIDAPGDVPITRLELTNEKFHELSGERPAKIRSASA